MTKDRTTPSSPSGPRRRVEQRVVAPLVIGVFAVLGLMNLPMHDDQQRVQNPLRRMMDKADRLVLDEFHDKSYKTPYREDIRVLGIDDASQRLDTLWEDDFVGPGGEALTAMKYPYPWQRRVWAILLDRLFAAGAKLVFLDLTFKSPSLDPEDDRKLREALQRHKGKVVIGAKFEQEFVGTRGQVKMMTPVASLGLPPPGPGSDVGILWFWNDSDDIVRKAQFSTTMTDAENRYAIESWETPDGVADPDEPTLHTVAYLLAEKIDPESVKGVPTEGRIRFGELGLYPPISLHQVFVQSLWEQNFQNGEIFKDKIIFVGATATDLQDFQQALPGRMAGVQLHAHCLAALLAGTFVQEAPESWRWIGIVAGFALAWLVVTFVRQPLLCLATLVLLGTACVYGGFKIFDEWSIEYSPLPSLMVLSLCGVSGLTGNFVAQLRESRKLQRFLVRYTSPEFAQEMMSDKASLYTTLGGVERTVTVFFSDVRGFTSMSENMTPTEVVTQLNEYLSRMVERVFEHRGLVDKFIGDAVMALWGSTRATPSEGGFKQDAINAVAASLAMRSSLAFLNSVWRERGINELQIGMGIHQGDVVVGNIGSEAPYEKMDLTVIGDPVNLASRLEGVTKEYGVDLIISDAVHRHVKDDFICRSADLVAVKGKVKPVEVFTVIGPVTGSPPPGLFTFEKAIRLYREGLFAKAESEFDQCAKDGFDDKLTHVYQERCRELKAHPPENWTGVYVMTKK